VKTRTTCTAADGAGRYARTMLIAHRHMVTAVMAPVAGSTNDALSSCPVAGLFRAVVERVEEEDGQGARGSHH
jgi:hypothetical protein